MEQVSDNIKMEIDDSDLFVSQAYGEGKRRTLRLTKNNILILQSVWEHLMIASCEAKKDKIIDEEFALGDRIKVTCSTDYPNINFRRWRKASYNGEIYPSDHGFILREDDFSIFEKNIKFFVENY